MSVASQLTALTTLKVMNSVSAANTAAATSGWIQVSEYEGHIAVIINTGIITGTIDYTFKTATSGAGAGEAAIVPLGGALAQVTTSNDDGTPYIAVFDTRKLLGYLQVIGTVVTGPALISYQIVGRKKTV
jgi:hypothetical protein